MGCDIHTYIEYKTSTSDRWRDFGGRINPGRNYWMFGFIAGVRTDDPPVVAARGLPSDLAYTCSGDSQLYITETEGEGYCSPDSAARWVANGSSVYVQNKDGVNTWVTHPDWHSHTWLTADEFELAIAAYLVKSGFSVNRLALGDKPDLASSQIAVQAEDNDKKYALSHITEYWAILQAMRCFEAQGHQARLVCWFDN